ncbi:MAG: FMN-binding glutamate synthase family protein [Clostridia bacterium]|jgi:methylamine---glutamate N-methyltransferase subunit C|nr:FMN-binding glutamate synthase family protein [Clostridia bacterium]MBT7123195.1 FMN-binding glutamate synthase family protein [Clostridia bacterium]
MRYECGVCGYVYDEAAEGVAFSELSEGWKCPICGAAKIYFKPMEEETAQETQETPKPKRKTMRKVERAELEYPSGFERRNDDIEPHMDVIHEMAISGKSVIEPMRSKLPHVSWADVYILGAQLSRLPLEEHDEVNTTTVIGKNAAKPMVIEHPVYITHMSFGALSKELKLSLSRGSAEAKTAMCSGEGGILPESMDAAYKYIFEYVPNKYSVTDENLKNADAIEIKVGQGTKPGMGGHLPGEKVTEEIAAIRNKPLGEDIISPCKFPDIADKNDLKKLVDELRERSKGRPIGVKIAAGHIEDDLEIVAFAGPDFVTIDGRAGGTGASPKVVKDATTIPTIFALCRARAFLDENNLDLDLVITGGLRVSSDFAKALACGADAIAIGSAAMMAAACQQYRVCDTGKCPVGCATQDEELRERLNEDNSAMRVANYLEVTRNELKTFARLAGYDDVHKLCVEDLVTVDSEVSGHTAIKHV